MGERNCYNCLQADVIRAEDNICVCRERKKEVNIGEDGFCPNFEETKKKPKIIHQHSPTDFAKTKEKKTKEKLSKKKVVRTSLLITDRFIVEQVYDSENKFCIYNVNSGEILYEYEFEDENFIYKPLEGEEIEKRAILLPTKAEEYVSDDILDEELKYFINKWLEIPEDLLQFSIWNIKRSWIYERFHTLNYLRALGDTGMGKSRFLDVLGYLHYKPIQTSGATTSAPIFRIIDKWKGTLIIDEADFDKSDESQDIIKIINQGYERGRNIMRCDMENKSDVNFFDPYCPKILATRKTFQDKAVESRCITHVMKGMIRKDIPYNLNKNFFDEVQTLRNKLLMWRFENYHKIDPNKQVELDLGDLEPRVIQIVSSFSNMFINNQQQQELFKNFIKEYQGDIIEERKDSFAGSVVCAIHDLMEEGTFDISAKDIIEKGELTDFNGKVMKPRGLSSTLKSFGFEKTKLIRTGEIIKRCIPLNPELLEVLFKRYGNDVTVVTIYTDKASIKNKLKLTDLGTYQK